MPYVYVPAYFAFVRRDRLGGGGRTADFWIAALAGWFLIHGHACFLLFVPALAGCAAVAAVLCRRVAGQAADAAGGVAVRSAPSGAGSWLPASRSSARCSRCRSPSSSPLHWPGNFGKYLTYSSSASRRAHPAPGWRSTCCGSGGRTRTPGRWPSLVLAAAAALLRLADAQRPGAAVRGAPAGLRRALDGVLFVAYAAAGVDALTDVLHRLLLLVGAGDRVARRSRSRWRARPPAGGSPLAAAARPSPPRSPVRGRAAHPDHDLAQPTRRRRPRGRVDTTRAARGASRAWPPRPTAGRSCCAFGTAPGST